MRCTECGRLNADGARFCDACGARLPGSSDAARKTVTVVFIDLAGSTALGERLELAIALHEEKGNVVNAEQCRRLLAGEPATSAGA